MSQRRRVLFICTANSARSLMAEAVLRQAAGDEYEVASAGTHPEAPHPMALQCLREAGISTEGLQSKPLSRMIDQPWDYVITLCDKASLECRDICEPAQRIAWDFPDPAEHPHHARFALVLKEIRERISLFVMVHQKASRRAARVLDPVAVFKALGDDNRLAIILLIRQQRELCVCELTAALELPQPNVSRHLGTLRDAGLLDGERRGQWIYYQLHPELPRWVLRILDETADANGQRISSELDRLATMPDRPTKTDCV